LETVIWSRKQTNSSKNMAEFKEAQKTAMLEIAIMIEGQNGLNWLRWQRIARAVEDLGYAGLYRSDHFTNANPPDLDSLECWTSLTWLASHTQRIEFGPLVSPFSFRHPALTARMAAAVDDLSGGRLTLGMGAGWQAREHTNFGFDLLPLPERFKRFEEGLEVVIRLLRSDKPVDFEGNYYHLEQAILLPRPIRADGPPLLVGGNGLRHTLPLAAQFADEWNGVFINAGVFAERNEHLTQLLISNGRKPQAVKRSIMVGCIYAKYSHQVEQKVARRSQGKSNVQDLRKDGNVVGTADEIAAQLAQFQDAGARRVMLQWLELDDMDGLEELARVVLPQFQS
jgi:F420-dependent oxidoreductase-like protein